MNRYTTTVVTVVAALSLLPVVAVAGMLGPQNYDDCILENMKGVGSNLAAAQVAASCARKFPPGKPTDKASPPANTTPQSTKNECSGSDPAEPRCNGFTNFVPDPVK